MGLDFGAWGFRTCTIQALCVSPFSLKGPQMYTSGKCWVCKDSGASACSGIAFGQNVGFKVCIGTHYAYVVNATILDQGVVPREPNTPYLRNIA